MQFDLSHQAPGEEARLWVPYPVSDPYQRISDVRITSTAEETAVYTDRVFSTPMLHASWPAGTGRRTLTFSYRVDRTERRHPDLPATEAAWNPADFAPWLAPTRLAPLDGPVKALADRITVGRTTVLAKARAIYDWTCENTYRNPDTRGCGAGDVCKLLEDPGGKCGDLSSIYVALCRAAGVPARHVLGLRLGGEDITTWQHCWTEFYLPGTGWVAADPADVRKGMLKRGLGRGAPVPADLREKFWAGVDADRVRVGMGRDLILNPPQAGEPLNYLMYPFAQVGGATLDWLDPETFRYTITYTPG
jgi:transglutaminase-like putative cysteine protease